MTANKIVIWCGGASNQKALANKIAARFPVAGIVIDKHKKVSRKLKWYQVPGLLWDRFRFRSIYNAWSELMQYYEEQFPEWPAGVPLLEVDTINDSKTKTFTEEKSPSLVIVSGTALIKEPLINIKTEKGIMNLHTGLSPYVKGGPNCTNWCIANNEFHLTGNTIMWLNAGIDTGNIITTETIDIRSAASLSAAHQVVMNHAQDLYGRAIEYVMKHPAPWSSVPQSTISKGNLYLTKMWTKEKKKQLLQNWKNRSLHETNEKPVTISLPVHE